MEFLNMFDKIYRHVFRITFYPNLKNHLFEKFFLFSDFPNSDKKLSEKHVNKKFLNMFGENFQTCFSDNFLSKSQKSSF